MTEQTFDAIHASWPRVDDPYAAFFDTMKRPRE